MSETPSSSKTSADIKTEIPWYKGSCHCGFFTYEAQIDLTSPKDDFNGACITKCNCTICHKAGAPLVPPIDGTFKILTPPQGREELSEYHFRDGNVHHYFCPKCSIKPLVEGKFTYGGKWFEFQRVNVLTIDGPRDGGEMVDLRTVKMGYYHGRGETWDKPVASEPYEGGIW